MVVRNPHAFHFPIQKFDDDIGLFKNFRYLEDFLTRLSQNSFPPFVIAPSDSVNKLMADLVLTGDDTKDEASMLVAVGDGHSHFQFLDGTITGSLMGNTATNRPQRNIMVAGLGPGVTIWNVPVSRHAILAEDGTDPSNADELMTTITGISFNMAATTGGPFNQPVWRVYFWNCEVYGGSSDGIGDGDSDSRGAVVWGNVFRDIGTGAGDSAIESPRNWIIANNYFANNNVNAIRLPITSIITGNHFLGSNTAIDFVSSTGDNNVIVGNYFNTTTVFSNLTAGSNIIGLNWPAATATVGMLDNEAIHDNVASEISAISNKGTIADGDFILIEDSAAGNVKKHTLFSEMEAVIDHDALANFVAAEHVTEASIDHGTIAGLTDDDHSAYPNYTEWTSYTPTLTNMTLGNGTLTASFTQIGKTVHTRIHFILGSTSSIDAINPLFSLPITAATYVANVDWVGGVCMLDTGTIRHFGSVTMNSTTAILMFTSGGASLSATVPMTWATGDSFGITFTYDAATAA